MLVSRPTAVPPSRVATLADGESIYGTDDGTADSPLLTNDASGPSVIIGDVTRPTVTASRLTVAGGDKGGLALPQYATGELSGVTGKPEGLLSWNRTTHLPTVWNGTTWVALRGPVPVAIPLCDYTTFDPVVDGDVVACGRCSFKPSDYAAPGYALSATLDFVADVSNGAIEALVDLVDAVTGVSVLTGPVSVSSVNPVELTTVVPVPGSAKIYQLILSFASGEGYMRLGGAILRLSWN